MLYLRWLAFVILLFFGGWAVIANWVISLRRGGGSPIPVLGGTFIAIALAVVPVNSLHWLWWVPLIADLGCVPLLLLTTGFFIGHAITRKKSDRHGLWGGLKL